ncbi:hypothetical protein [Streptomyces tubercidicus]|uniref:hypothetical protein n=1 Tax=Streptomyces tubercidicus TaxID=47759 RepID=UPI0034672EF1
MDVQATYREIRILFDAVAVAACSIASHKMEAVMVGQISVPMVKGYDFGVGADLSSGSPMARAIDGERSGVEGAHGTTVSFELRRTQTTAELEETLGINVEASLGCAAFGSGMSARFSFAKSSKIQSSSLFMALVARVGLEFLSIDEPTLTPDAEKLVDNQPQFAQRFGNMFVRGVTRGGLFLGVLRIETSGSDEAQDISAALQGTYGLFSAEAEANMSKVQRDHQSEISYLMYHEGGPTDLQVGDPNDPLQLLRNANLFLDSFQSRPEEVSVAYDATLAPITIARGPLPPNAADIEHAQDVIQFCARRRSALLDQLNLLQHITDQPSRYVFSDEGQNAAIIAAASATASDLDLIAACASRAMGNPSKAKMPVDFAAEQGVEFPKGILPPLPSPALRRDVSGVYRHVTEGVGEASWTFTPEGGNSYHAQEQGIGNAQGSAVFTENDNRLVIEFVAGGTTGVYDWTLDESLAAGEGTLTFHTGGDGRVHASRLIRIQNLPGPG